MVQSVMTSMFSPGIERTSTQRTTSMFIAFRGQAEVLPMHSFDMLKDSQKMLDIYLHTDVTLVDGLTLQGGEWPSVPWYTDTPETGAAT